MTWDGVHISSMEKARSGGGTFQCLNLNILPAGRYRVAVRVFEDAAQAAAHLDGRVVTRDFDLPSPDGVVDVPLAANALDDCDPAPGATSPPCTGAEARDTPCSLSETLGCEEEGGNGAYVDSSQVAPPAAYQRRRVFTINPMPDLNCSTPVPRCSRDSRVVTTSDIVRVTTEPTVASAFASGPTPVYGYDQRANDGSILVLRRADSTSLGIGGECPTCANPLTPALRVVRPVFTDLWRQSVSTSACAAFGGEVYY